MTWMLVLSLNQSYEDCITIAVAAANKNQCVAISVIHLLSQEQCDFADLFPSTTVLMTFLILTAHFLWNKCRYAFRFEKKYDKNCNKIFVICRATSNTTIPYQNLDESLTLCNP